MIVKGWPDTIQEVPPSIRSYWSFRDVLSISVKTSLKTYTMLTKGLRKPSWERLGLPKAVPFARSTSHPNKEGNSETTWSPTTSMGSPWHRFVPLPRRRVHAGSRLIQQVLRCSQTWTEHQQQHGEPILEADTCWAWDSPEDHQQ